jgi:hypothetical protein
VFDPQIASKSVNWYADSESMIALAKAPQVTPRSKGIHIRFHIVRECVANKVVNLFAIPGQINTADIFTKPLGPERHMQLVKQLMGPILTGLSMHHVNANLTRGMLRPEQVLSVSDSASQEFKEKTQAF